MEMVSGGLEALGAPWRFLGGIGVVASFYFKFPLQDPWFVTAVGSGTSAGLLREEV